MVGQYGAARRPKHTRSSRLRASSLSGEALAGSFSPLDRLDRSVVGRVVSHELVEQARRCKRDLVDSAIEGLGVGLRGLRRAADLADVLQRGVGDLAVSRGRFVIVE